MSNNTETFIIQLKDKGVVSGLKKAGKETDDAKRKATALNSVFSKLGVVFGGFSLAFLGREIVQNVAEFEKFEAVLTNTLGSSSAAQKALGDIADFAAKTPFAVDRLTGAYVKLANQGFKPTINEMTKLGDLASSTGKDFDQLAEAIIDGQVGEFERLKEFGIRAQKSGDKVQFSFKGVKKEVDFTETAMRGYILSLGDVQGVSGAMAAISETTGGKISNLGDKVTQLYINLGQKLKPVITGVIEVFSDTIDSIGSLVNWLAKGGLKVDLLTILVSSLTAGFVAYKVAVIASSVASRVAATYQLALAAATQFTGIALKGATLWTQAITVAQWAWNVALTANPIGIVIVAVAALIAAIVVAWYKFEKFRAVMKGVWATIKQVGINIKDNFLAIPNLVIRAFQAIPNAIKQIFSGVGELFDAIFSGDFGKIPDIIKNTLVNNDLSKLGQEFIANQVEGAKKAGSAFVDAYDKEIEESQAAKAKKDEENFVNGKGAGIADPSIDPTGGIKGGKNNKGAGISEVKASAPKTFNINIESLIKEQTISTTNMTEGAAKIRDLVTKALLTATNDAQIIAE